MKIIPCNSEISHYKVAEKLLEDGVTMVHVINGREGVVLPEECSSMKIVHLNFSYRYGIDDFCVDKRGIRASLSFRGVPKLCDIPWSAVCAISSQNTDQYFIWVTAFDANEIEQFLPPDIRGEFSEIRDQSLLDEIPYLKEFAFDDVLKKLDGESSGEDGEDAEDEEEDDDPGEFPPLRFV
ncbi:MAG: hypothetical protein II767_03495 [Proteobacteria bacterium]|nr:hypothetical protein [Pseudomonadota bacterium]